jgi:hypothetical protein
LREHGIDGFAEHRLAIVSRNYHAHARHDLLR